MSSNAQRYRPTKRHAIRVALADRELARELSQYRRNGKVGTR